MVRSSVGVRLAAGTNRNCKLPTSGRAAFLSSNFWFERERVRGTVRGAMPELSCGAIRPIDHALLLDRQIGLGFRHLALAGRVVADIASLRWQMYHGYSRQLLGSWTNTL